MSASLLTEISSPFLNLYWVLTFHKNTTSKLYLYNNVILFLTFFFGRILFQLFLIVEILIPGAINTDTSNDSGFMVFILYLSASIYPWLYFLNLYWFYKMVKVVIDMVLGKGEN